MWGSIFMAVVFLFTFPVSFLSCRNIISTVMNVEIGDVPQVVEHVYIESPDGINVEIWQEGLVVPWSLVFLPNGDALVSERPGRILLITNDEVQEQPYFTFDNVVHNYGSEAGLMGLALHPDFDNEPYVYVKYTHRQGNVHDNRVVRLRHDGTTGNFDRVIVDGIPASNNHNGGRIGFGPDERLYIATGEIYERNLAQDMESLGGKFLRVTAEGEIPDDNPFDGSVIYTLGHRNPQGFDWHPETGDLFSSEHGPSGEMALRGKDIINVIYPGENYGWPLVVGEVNHEEYEDPIVMWEQAVPPSGVAFWQDDLFVATLRSQALVRITMDVENDGYQITGIEHWFSPSSNQGEFGRLRDVVLGPDDALYVLTNNRDGRGNPADNDDRILRITR
jgi:glucose/arabinose dehydrogenase